VRTDRDEPAEPVSAVADSLVVDLLTKGDRLQRDRRGCGLRVSAARAAHKGENEVGNLFGPRVLGWTRASVGWQGLGALVRSQSG